MPTENRSSNTEMVSVPEGYMLVERSIWTERQVEAATACISRLKSAPTMADRTLAMAAIDAAQCTAPEIALSDLLPAPQPHPEPIAWMVGTAFWWTKEEAERDAAETGKTITPIGPMSGIAPAEQHQGEPAAEVTSKILDVPGITARRDLDVGTLLYTHADPGEVERLRDELVRMNEANWRGSQYAIKLQAQLAERDALLRSIVADWEGPGHFPVHDSIRRIRTALSASAEPEVNS